MAADDAAVVVTLRADLKGYEAALKAAVRATEKAAKAAEGTISNVGKGRGGRGFTAINDNFQKSAGQMASDARILQFQLNDIFSGLASGQGIRAVQQQLGQIAQQMSGGGLAAGARTLGTALIGMVNPVNAAVVAFGFLASAAVEYFTGVDEAAEKTNRELDKHYDALKSIADRYKTLAPAAQEAIAEIMRIRQVKDDIKVVSDEVDRLREESIKKLTDGLAEAGEQIDELELARTLGADEAAERVATLREKIQALIDTLAKGEDPADAMAAAVTEMAGLSWDAPKAGIDTWLQGLEKVKPALFTIIQHYRTIAELQRLISERADAMVAPMRGPLVGSDVILGVQNQRFRQGNADADASRAFLRSKAATQKIADSIDNLTDDMAKAAAKLFAILPETARITSAVRSRAEQAAAYARYQSGAGGLAAPPGRSKHEVGAAIDVGAGVDMETLREAVKLVPELTQLKGKAYAVDKVHVQLAKAAEDIEVDRIETEAEHAKNIADWNIAAEDKIRLEKQIADINAQVWESEASRAAQVEALRIAEERLAELRRAGIPVTAEMEAQIRSLARAQAEVTLQSEEAAARQKQATEQQKKNAEALKQTMQQFEGLATSALTGFISDLRNGVDAGEAFNNMLNKIIDSLIQIGVQMAVKSLFSGFGFPTAHGGGSVSLLAGNSNRKASPLMFAGAPKFATGGMVGLRPGEVPIIAHRGEIIVPNARRLAGNAGRGGTQNNYSMDNAKISIDMAQTGMVAANSDSARQFGEDVQKLIQAEMVRQSRPGGLLRKVPS